MKDAEKYIYGFGSVEIRRMPGCGGRVSLTLCIKADSANMEILDIYSNKGIKVMGERLHSKWGYYSEDEEAARYIREEIGGICLEHAFDSARERGMEEAKILEEAIAKKEAASSVNWDATSDALKDMTGKMIARWGDRCKYDPESVEQCFHGIQKNLDLAIDAGDFEYLTQCLADISNYALLAYMAQSKVLKSVKKA